MRRDALRFNPVRDVGNFERGERRAARALTVDEAREWLALLDSDAYAVRKDIPDTTGFLLGTGVRIGEALDVRWRDVDLDRGLVHIRPTVVWAWSRKRRRRPPGNGCCSCRRGLRRCWLSVAAALMAMRRCSRMQREATGPGITSSATFARCGPGTPYAWVVPHTYRKTVATFLDNGGLSARVVADQLGHARISMTQDVYMGRHVTHPSAASTLEQLSRRSAMLTAR